MILIFDTLTGPVEQNLDPAKMDDYQLVLFHGSPEVAAEVERRQRARRTVELMGSLRYSDDQPRDDHGRFADEGGGDWKQIDAHQWQVDKLNQGLAGLAGRFGVQTDEQMARIKASDEAAIAANPARFVLVNGDTTIVSFTDKVTPDQVTTAIGPAVDRLQSIDPRPGMQISIDGGMLRNRSDDTLGASIRGDTSMDMRSGVFTGVAPDGSSISPYGWMPAAKDVSPAEYVVTHEWGHAIEPAQQNIGATVDAIAANHDHNEISPYGHSSRDGTEAYAEGYTEWRLTGGKPLNTDGQPNGFVTEMAARFGWKT